MHSLVRALKPQLVSGLLLGGLLIPPAMHAALNPQEKMDLFTDALAARDAGEYYIARQNLEILAREFPLDSLVESTLREVNDLIETSEQARQNGILAAPSEAESEIDSLVRDEMDRQSQALNRAERAVLESGTMIRNGNYDRALAVVYSALRTLPDNVRTQSVRDRLNLKKADALFAQANHLLISGNKSAAWESLAALAVLEGNSSRFKQLKTAFDTGRRLQSSTELSFATNPLPLPGNVQSPQPLARQGAPGALPPPGPEEIIGVVGVDANSRNRLNLAPESDFRSGQSLEPTTGFGSVFL